MAEEKRPRKPLEVLLEIVSNATPFWVAVLLNLNKEEVHAIETLVETEFEALLNALAADLAAQWNEYILSSGGAAPEILDTVIGIVEGPFTAILNRLLKIS